MKTFYDSPITITMGPFEGNNIFQQVIEEINNKTDEHIALEVSRAIGIDIDKDALVSAITNDRRRYEEAYRHGYSDAKKEYEEKLKSIKELIEGE